jgi:hypothetical protein
VPSRYIIAVMPRMPKIDPELLQAALIGFQQRATEIEERMAELRRQIGRRGGARIPEAEVAPAGKRRRLSAAARARIAEAQHKRGTAYHEAQGSEPASATEPMPGRREVSQPGRKRISGATKKRREQVRAKKAAAPASKKASARIVPKTGAKTPAPPAKRPPVRRAAAKGDAEKKTVPTPVAAPEPATPLQLGQAAAGE